MSIQMIYNVVLVSGVQHSDSVLYIYIHFQILFPYGLLLNIVDYIEILNIVEYWI